MGIVARRPINGKQDLYQNLAIIPASYKSCLLDTWLKQNRRCLGFFPPPLLPPSSLLSSSFPLSLLSGHSPILLPGWSLPSRRQYLHQSCSCSEAHFGNRLPFPPSREAIEAGARAGEGAERRGARRDRCVWDAAAVVVVSHTESSPAGQGVYDLPREAARQSIHPQTLPYKALSASKHPEPMTVAWLLALTKNRAARSNKQF